jgi:hypothetical protein
MNRARSFLLTLATAVGLVGAALFGIGACIWFTSRPPAERVIVDRFKAHRQAFERLREMLVADVQLSRVADWGVELAGAGPRRQPETSFPRVRYEDYLRLLREVEARAGYRSEDGSIGIAVWGAGFGGDTRHMNMCWLQTAPAHQVASIDEYHNDRTLVKKGGAYKHVEGNWWLWADF